jgi:hypothetical protein
MWHNIAEFFSKNRFRLVLVVLILIVLLAAGEAIAYFGGAIGHNHAQDMEMAKELIQTSRLAPLPAAAKDVQFDCKKWFSSWTWCLKFSASPQEIGDFIDNSTALSGIRPEKFTENHTYNPVPDNDALLDEEDKYYFPDKRFPWYLPIVGNSGVKFEFNDAAAGIKGEVVVNFAAGAVFVKATHE